MTRCSFVLSVAALMALSAFPAAAQDRETVQVAHGLATCLVRGSLTIANAYIAHGTPTMDSSAYDRMLDAACLPQQGYPPLSPRLVRGAIYEALYDRDSANGASATFENVPPLALPDGGADPALDGALLRFGECIARAVPVDSRALLATQPASAEENAAIGTLTPHLSPCMQNGLTISFSPSILRGVVAEALYKLSHGAPAVANR